MLNGALEVLFKEAISNIALKFVQSTSQKSKK
jgi:hypothetical protein